MQYLSQRSLYLQMIFLLMPALASAAADYAGSYEGPTLSAVIRHHGDAYDGEIHLGSQSFPLTAHEQAGRLVGAFRSGGDSFEFSASLDGSDLSLVSGGTTYNLTRHVAAPANPLAAPDASAAGGPLARYKVIVQTDAGRTLAIELSNVSTLDGAFKSVFPDLERFFGARPTITGAFADGQEAKSGFASFDAKLNGQSIKGFVAPRIKEHGALVYVVYGRADAPTLEWKKLMGLAPAQDIPLKQYDFPDGTGSVGLAEGWHTDSKSLMGAVLMTGPAEQQILLDLTLNVVTPQSNYVQRQRRAEANARVLGLPPPPPLAFIVAEVGDPGQTLANITPGLSQINQRAGGPAITLDKMIGQEPQKASGANGNAAIVRYDVTHTANGTARHFRCAARVEVDAMLQGMYMITLSELMAPMEAYDRDEPIMVAMACSIKVNEQVVAAKQQINLRTQNEIFKSTMDSARRHQLAQGRQTADFDEVLIGSRTIQNTDTGAKSSVDLSNSHQIVQRLNQTSGHHYIEIPLRDELYPLAPVH